MGRKTRMNDAVERAKEALEGVTDGPWRAVHVGNIHWGVSNGEWNFPTVVKADCGYDGYGSGSSQANAQFIAEARTLVPELVAEVEKWQAAAVYAHDDNGALQAMTAERDELAAEVERLRARVEQIVVRTHPGLCYPDCGCPDSAAFDWDGFADDINGVDL